MRLEKGSSNTVQQEGNLTKKPTLHEFVLGARCELTGTAATVVIDSVFTVIYLLVSTPILRGWLDKSFNRAADSQSFLVEVVTGIHAVKAHASESAVHDRWEGLFARYIRTNFRASTTSNISNSVGTFLSGLTTILILYFGAKLVISQYLSVGQLVAFNMLVARVTGPLIRLLQLWHLHKYCYQ